MKLQLYCHGQNVNTTSHQSKSVNNSQINYQGRNPLPATPFGASRFVSCETENMYF